MSEKKRKIKFTYIDHKNERQTIKLNLIYSNHIKEDLGGYKDVESSNEYYHAYAQTDQIQ